MGGAQFWEHGSSSHLVRRSASLHGIGRHPPVYIYEIGSLWRSGLGLAELLRLCAWYERRAGGARESPGPPPPSRVVDKSLLGRGAVFTIVFGIFAAVWFNHLEGRCAVGRRAG